MQKAIIVLSLVVVIVLAPILHAADKIDINKATEEELLKIPTIGPKIAKMIIEYRKTNGKFKSIDELRQVKGIGPKRLEAIRERVIIGED